MPTQWDSEEAVHHPCDNHFKNRQDEVRMVHRCSNKGLHPMHKEYSVQGPIRILSHHTQLQSAQVIWKEVLGFHQSLHLSAREHHRRLINVQCLSINRPNQSLDPSSIDYERLSMRIRITANRLSC